MILKKKIERRNLIWIDLEMTGLSPETDVILEIATIVTDDQLEILAYGPELIIHHSDSVLERMNEWVTKAHGKSGLTEAVKTSNISTNEAEQQTIEFLKQYFEPDQGVICGNSVWNDKAFMRIHMPELHNFMNYRIIDVSSIKEIVQRWYPENPYAYYKKGEAHRALVDIEESIKELKHYRQHFFIPPELIKPETA